MGAARKKNHEGRRNREVGFDKQPNNLKHGTVEKLSTDEVPSEFEGSRSS